MNDNYTLNFIWGKANCVCVCIVLPEQISGTLHRLGKFLINVNSRRSSEGNGKLTI